MSKKRKQSITEWWSTFCQYDPSFALHYAVYHYYRSLGWVPKNGTKFGVDFGKDFPLSIISSL
jgi:tRNA-splicing endonuclease subunit Sen2